MFNGIKINLFQPSYRRKSHRIYKIKLLSLISCQRQKKKKMKSINASHRCQPIPIENHKTTFRQCRYNIRDRLAQFEAECAYQLDSKYKELMSGIKKVGSRDIIKACIIVDASKVWRCLIDAQQVCQCSDRLIFKPSDSRTAPFFIVTWLPPVFKRTEFSIPRSGLTASKVVINKNKRKRLLQLKLVMEITDWKAINS